MLIAATLISFLGFVTILAKLFILPRIDNVKYKSVILFLQRNSIFISFFCQIIALTLILASPEYFTWYQQQNH